MVACESLHVAAAACCNLPLADAEAVSNLMQPPSVLTTQHPLKEPQSETPCSVPLPAEVLRLSRAAALRVRLDGYSKREWVTDEDEWEWVEVAR